MPNPNEINIDVDIPDDATPAEVEALEQAAIDNWINGNDGGLGAALDDLGK
jgi:hypothetical protein